MNRTWAGVALLVVSTATFGQVPSEKQAPATPSLYERVGAKLAGDPALARRLAEQPKQLDAVAWWIGSWEVTAHVFATKTTPERTDHGQEQVERLLGGSWLSFRDTYPTGTQDLGFVTFDAVQGVWRAVHLDSTGTTVIAISKGWENGKLVFLTRDAVILGEKVELRQTVEKRSDDEYRLLNEERLASGTWLALDEYLYKRKRPNG
jgi:hypothetical protein